MVRIYGHKSEFRLPSPTHVRILASQVNLLFRYCFPVSNDKLTNAISSRVAFILKAERERRELSLQVLARKSGISRQTISYIEQEVQSPSLDTLLRITLALEVDLAKIIARAQRFVAKGKPSAVGAGKKGSG
jgi:DNA-binding XRE family transcriptional regulator